MNAEDVEKIQRMYASGKWSQQALAKEFGISLYELRKYIDGVLKGTPPYDERFWRSVQISDEPNACWLWIGRKDDDGYGETGFTLEGTRRAAKIAYMLTYGEIPFGLIVRHTCDNPPCVNPAHLILGTRGNNNGDIIERERWRPRGQLDAIQQLEAAIFADDIPGVTRFDTAKRFGVSGSTIKRARKRDRFVLQRAAAELQAKRDAERERDSSKGTNEDTDCVADV